MEACLFDAILREEEGSAIRINEALCTNCDLCPAACPIGAIHIPHDHEVAIACDLCDGAPVCVEHCIYGALRYEARPDEVFQDFGEPLEGESVEQKRWRIATTIAEEVREISGVGS
jgi:Fe-S-cluster-containing hydrogenase component 2